MSIARLWPPNLHAHANPGASVIWTMPRMTDYYTQGDPTGSVCTGSFVP